MKSVVTEYKNVKQGTIICQNCGDIIESVDSPEGVKTWYGICTECSKEKVEIK